MAEAQIRFEDGAAYERTMGVWSRLARASRLDILWDLRTGAGLEAIETRTITVKRTFADFEDFWTTSLMHASMRAAAAAMASNDVELLKTRVRAPAGDAAGRITYGAHANAIKGRVRVILRRLHQLDPRIVPRRGGEPVVAGEQCRVERFGERDIGGIIGGQVVAQFPDPLQQHIVRVAVQGKIKQIVQRGAAACGFDLPGRRIAPEHMRHLDIDQMGRMQRLPSASEALPHRGSGRRSQQKFHERRGVDDDHRESRSARITSSGEGCGLVAECFSRRSIISARLGRSATRRNSSSK